MCKKLYVESPVTQTQRVAVLDSNHLKKKSCDRNTKARIYESCSRMDRRNKNIRASYAPSDCIARSGKPFLSEVFSFLHL